MELAFGGLRKLTTCLPINLYKNIHVLLIPPILIQYRGLYSVLSFYAFADTEGSKNNSRVFIFSTLRYLKVISELLVVKCKTMKQKKIN